MRIDYLSSDILLFRGDSLAALATAFIHGNEVLLVDALASQYDAIDMRDYLETTLHKRVVRIVLTRAGSHDAALALFPDAEVISGAARAGALRFGRHALDVFAIPSVGGDALGVDVAGADMLFVGDAIIGNIATLGAATPDQADALLASLQERGRGIVVPRNQGAVCGRALANARTYLAGLRQQVGAARAAHADPAAAIGAIELDGLLAAGEHATPLERHWHRDNLRQVGARGLFPALAQAPAGAARSRTQACCETIKSVLTAMLGRLAERGV